MVHHQTFTDMLAIERRTTPRSEPTVTNEQNDWLLAARMAHPDIISGCARMAPGCPTGENRVFRSLLLHAGSSMLRIRYKHCISYSVGGGKKVLFSI